MICVSSNNGRRPVTKTFTPLHPTTLYSTSLHLLTIHFLLVNCILNACVLAVIMCLLSQLLLNAATGQVHTVDTTVVPE